MQIIGLDSLQAFYRSNFELKVVVNERAALIFPCANEHRDMKVDGLSYEDDYRGNALAAMLRPNQIEFRFHSSFSSSRVLTIGTSFFKLAKEHLKSPFSIHYQGTVIGVLQ
ncbi:hypothetical protein SH501x_001156 [Pirellulaceae bacterium SH501]